MTQCFGCKDLIFLTKPGRKLFKVELMKLNEQPGLPNLFSAPYEPAIVGSPRFEFLGNTGSIRADFRKLGQPYITLTQLKQSNIMVTHRFFGT